MVPFAGRAEGAMPCVFLALGLETVLEALLTSTAVVALAEIGDKTQLLAIILATRFRKPLPIVPARITAAPISDQPFGRSP